MVIKSKVKYIIVASNKGRIYGAFFPKHIDQAQRYLTALRVENPRLNLDIYNVSNLNRFSANLNLMKTGV